MSSLGETKLKPGTRVQNVSGTGDDRPPRRYKSWKQHYVGNDDREWPSKCRIRNCKQPENGGGHVRVQGKRDVYIVPMCDKKHNTAHVNDWLPVKKDTVAQRVYREDNRRLENRKREANEGDWSWCVIV